MLIRNYSIKEQNMTKILTTGAEYVKVECWPDDNIGVFDENFCRNSLIPFLNTAEWKGFIDIADMTSLSSASSNPSNCSMSFSPTPASTNRPWYCDKLCWLRKEVNVGQRTEGRGRDEKDDA